MKFRAITFGLMTLILAFMIVFNPSPAYAQVSCDDITATLAWPPTGNTFACDGSTHGDLMRATLETIGINGSDAAARLRGETVTANVTVGVTISDDGLSPAAVQVTTDASDTSVTIANRIAEAINGDTELSQYVYAYLAGTQLTIYSFSGETTYSSVQTGSGILSYTDLGGGNASLEITGTAGSTDIIWYNFATFDDYMEYEGITNKDSGPGADEAWGFTYNEGMGEKYSAIYDESGDQVANDFVKYVTAHETGHHLSAIYGAIDGAPDGEISHTELFLGLLDIDKAAMAGIPACAFDVVDMYGNYASSGTDSPDPYGPLYNGFFQYAVDSNGDPMCTGPRGEVYEYEQMALDSIEPAYPRFAYDANEPEEMFADLAAMTMGFTDLIDNDDQSVNGDFNLFQGNQPFLCSALYVDRLLWRGRVPTPNELASYFYVVPDGSSSPYGTGFTIYFCDGSSEHHDYVIGS